MSLENGAKLASVLLSSLILFLSLVAITRSGEQGTGGKEEEEVEEEAVREGQWTVPICPILPVCENSSPNTCNFEVQSKILESNYHFYGPEISNISQENLQYYTCDQTAVPAWDECEGNMSFGVQKVLIPANDYKEEEEAVNLDSNMKFILADWVVANVCLNALAPEVHVPEDCTTQVGIVELVSQDRVLFKYSSHQNNATTFECARDWRLKNSDLHYVINPGTNNAEQLPTLPGLPFVNVPTAHALFNTSTASSPGKMTLLAHMPEYLKLPCTHRYNTSWKLFRAEFVLEKYIMIVPISNCRQPHAITGEVIQLLSFSVLDVNCSNGTHPVVNRQKTTYTNRTLSDEEKSTYQTLLSNMASNGWGEYIRRTVYDDPHTRDWMNYTDCTINPFPDGEDLAHCSHCNEIQRAEEMGQVRDEL